MPESPPVVLSLSGHDPSGGAGIQADIEAIGALNCIPCTIVTALTLQDTGNIRQVFPQPVQQIEDQLGLLDQDVRLNCIKIGLLGSVDTIEVIDRFLKQRPSVPVVLDPVLAAGGGFDVAYPALLQALANRLLPLSTVAVPNCQEAARITGLDEGQNACGKRLVEMGCENVLITGADRDTAEVVNAFYAKSEPPRLYRWERLPGSFHGSGCTLASAIAAYLARGHQALDAVEKAQEFTWQSLKAGFQPGQGQRIPNRLFRIRNP